MAKNGKTEKQDFEVFTVDGGGFKIKYPANDIDTFIEDNLDSATGGISGLSFKDTEGAWIFTPLDKIATIVQGDEGQYMPDD